MANPFPGYDPEQRFEVRSWELEYRRLGDEPMLWTVYQPEGDGPFNAVLDVHGGAWTGGHRTHDALIDQALAASGLVVAAMDFRRAPDHPYPAEIVDVNYAIRWFKAHADEFNADPRTLGALGESSGGHTLVLGAMRPEDPRYAALPLEEDPTADARLNYLMALWPVLDPIARYVQAKERGATSLVTHTEGYFLTDEAMQEGNPQLVLERGEPAERPPLLIVQAMGDTNIPTAVPERFATAYASAGGDVMLEQIENVPHGFARIEASPEADHAFAVMKAFVARQLARLAASSIL